LIDSIKGTLVKKNPTSVIIDIGGIRLGIPITLATFEKIPDPNHAVELLTYLHVREDIMELYGFYDDHERDVFMQLNSISGIGPRSAMNILSGTNPIEFKKKIIDSDVASLTSIPGIGTKTAKRIIVELKDKFTDQDTGSDLDFLLESSDKDKIDDVTKVLISLGYKRSAINQVIKKLVAKDGLDENIEDIIKGALKLL
jgi:Holliday junction DNA helicase RuvA|tara:strand:+ start:7 stop:603 length:597 start_codon:yes stop_codon:yes gene_type:complete